MEIRYPANVAKCFGKTYIDCRNILVTREPEKDYVVLKNVDFGSGKRGLEIQHYSCPYVCAVEARLDSLDGKSIGCVCTAAFSFDNLTTSWNEIEETSGMHDVYFVFHGTARIRAFRFTNASPYDSKDYTPVPDSRIIDVGADTWEATDMLGRKVSSPEDCPEKRDKKVGIFYWTWHENNSINDNVQSIIETLENYPEAEFDEKHPAWGIFDAHWNKPLFGYYRDTDPYIIRKHLIMLANAGVDYIAFDNTNGTGLMREAYTTLLEQMRQAKLDGINVPKIIFMMNFWPSATTLLMLRAIYQDLYKPGLYEDLWFKIDGKPVVMAYPESIPEEGYGPFDTAFLNEIREYFCFRPGQPSYAQGPVRDDQWGWLESAPQHKFIERPDGSCEQMTVGVAQNRTDNGNCTRFNIVGSYGRSYTHKDGHSALTDDSFLYGYNFQEQWDNAIAADPDMIFVTGWNEWTAGRWHGWGIPEDSTQLAFVDQFDREHSRDIEPDCDGYLDTYYLQLCANIRKFKGTSKLPAASSEVSGNIDWDTVAPTYRNHKGSTPYRDYPGFGKHCRYSNRSMRNDITSAKVARDAENLYFFAKCEDSIVDTDKENCMLLFINSDRNAETGWNGYNYRISGNNLQKNVGTLKNNGYGWENVAEVTRTYNGDSVVVTVKKADLGITDTIDFEFKWVDNCFREIFPAKYDVMDFYTSGVSAPFGRFNYRYKV